MNPSLVLSVCAICLVVLTVALSAVGGAFERRRPAAEPEPEPTENGDGELS